MLNRNNQYVFLSGRDLLDNFSLGKEGSAALRNLIASFIQTNRIDVQYVIAEFTCLRGIFLFYGCVPRMKIEVGIYRPKHYVGK